MPWNPFKNKQQAKSSAVITDRDYLGKRWKSVDLPSEQMVQKVAKKLGGEFPEDYVDFLVSTNGGRPQTPAYFLVNGDNPHFTQIHTMRGVIPGENLPTIEDAISQLPNLMQRGLVPIGFDHFDGQLCYSIEDLSLYYVPWSPAAHAVTPGEGFVADDFDSFLQLMSVSEISIDGTELSCQFIRDKDAANNAAGLPETPDGQVWHYDHRQPGRMQLVPFAVHQQAGFWG